MSRSNRAARRAQQGKGRSIGLTPEQVEAKKTQLRGSDKYRRRIPPYSPDGQARTFAASEYWIDLQLPIFRDRRSTGETIVYRFFAPQVVPAGFIRCPKCGHQCPAHLIGSSGHCMDCRYSYGPCAPRGSATIVDMRELRKDPEGLEQVYCQEACAAQ